MSKRAVVVLAALAAVVIGVIVFFKSKNKPFTNPTRVKVGDGSLIIDNVDYSPLVPNRHWQMDPFDLHTTGHNRIATVTQQVDGCPSTYDWCPETPLCDSECEVDIQYANPLNPTAPPWATLKISSSWDFWPFAKSTHMKWQQNPPDPNGTGFQDTRVWNAVGSTLTFTQFQQDKITAITVAGQNHADPAKHNQIWVAFQ